MFAEIMAVFTAIKEINASIKLLVKLKQDSIDASLDKIQKDVNETLIKIHNAKTDQDRAELVRLLNSRISK